MAHNTSHIHHHRRQLLVVQAKRNKAREVVVERVEDDAKENEKLNGVKKPEDAENTAELVEEESPEELS